MKRLCLTLFGAAAIAALIAFGIAAGGWISVSALVPPDKLDALLSFASHRSVARHATSKKNDFANDQARIAQGLAYYRKDCLDCHGAPGIAARSFAKGLNPPAPDLAASRTQALSDGELFWIICNGIRATGMPSFGASHTEEDIWEMTAFLRQLPQLPATDRARLAR